MPNQFVTVYGRIVKLGPESVKNNEVRVLSTADRGAIISRRGGQFGRYANSRCSTSVNVSEFNPLLDGGEVAWLAERKMISLRRVHRQ